MLDKPTLEDLERYVRDPTSLDDEGKEACEPVVVDAILWSKIHDDFSPNREEWFRQGLLNDYMDGAEGDHGHCDTVFDTVVNYVHAHPGVARV